MCYTIYKVVNVHTWTYLRSSFDESFALFIYPYPFCDIILTPIIYPRPEMGKNTSKCIELRYIKMYFDTKYKIPLK